MNKFVFIASSAFLLTACGTPSVEDLIEDPEKLSEINIECQMMEMQGKDTNTEECINAAKATQQMAKNLLKGMRSNLNGAFGK